MIGRSRVLWKKNKGSGNLEECLLIFAKKSDKMSCLVLGIFFQLLVSAKRMKDRDDSTKKIVLPRRNETMIRTHFSLIQLAFLKAFIL